MSRTIRDLPTFPSKGQTVEITWKDKASGKFLTEAIKCLTRPLSPWTPREYVTVSGRRVVASDVIVGGF